jgi:hypothetical protein
MILIKIPPSLKKLKFMKSNIYLLLLAFLLLGSTTNAQDVLLQSFDDPGAIGNWKNSTAGSYTLSGSTDAVEGSGSISIAYNLVGDQGWGGSVDIQMNPGGAAFPDMSSADGVSFWFKAPIPASTTTGATWNTKLYVASTGGEEQWHFSVNHVIGDASGGWVKAELPFSSFSIPSWLTTYDGVLYQDKIVKIEMQLLVNEGVTTTGELLIDNLSSYKAGGTSVGTLLQSFDESGSIGSWQNSTAGSYSLTGSGDAVEGTGSVCLDYILIADQSWGGSIDMQFLPGADFFPDLSGDAGIRFNYKVTQPASVTNGFSLTAKLFIQSSDPNTAEQWHAALSGNILADPSGEWQEAKLSFQNFAIPSWEPTFDGVLYLDKILRIELQIVTGTAGLETNGNICFDNLTSYSAGNVTLYDGFTLNNYDAPSTVGSWINSTAGSYTLSSSNDAAVGDSSACVSYNLVGDQGWGGSVDLQMLPGGDVFQDMTGHEGISFWYKVTEPASVPANVSFVIKLFVNSTGGEEQWHKTVGGVLNDGTGEWKRLYIPFSTFAIPNWLTTYDGILYQDQIREIQFQILGQEGTTTTGGICFDNLISYDDEEVVVGMVTPVKANVKIYPNPVSSRLTINGLNNIDRIGVYRLNGSFVKQVNGDSFVEVGDLKPGFYFLKIYTAKNVYSAKFIKQ